MQSIKMTYLYVLFLICLVGVQRCLTACTDPNGATISANGFAGTWYLVGAKSIDSEVRCTIFEVLDFSADSTPYLSINLYQIINEVETTTTPKFEWKFTGSTTSGSFYEFNGLLTDGNQLGDVKVVAVDYNNYAVIYRCAGAGLASEDFLELWSRSEDGYSSAMAAATSSLPGLGLDVGSIVNNPLDCTPPTTPQSANKFKTIYNNLKTKLSG